MGLSRVLVVAIYVVVVELSGHNSVANTCSTEDCKLTGEDFIAFMNPDQKPCRNFYEYACGKATEFLKSKRYHDQYNYLSRTVKEFATSLNADAAQLMQSPIEPGDSNNVKLVKRYYELCTKYGTSKDLRLNEMVKFLNDLPINGSWWDLETFSIQKGFESSIFRTRKTEHNAITFEPQQLDSFMPDVVKDIFKKLKKRGLSSPMAQLLKTCSDESWQRDLYPPTSPNETAVLDLWPDFWNADVNRVGELAREDWNLYFNDYWPRDSRSIDWIRRINVILESSDTVSKMGAIWEDKAKKLKTLVACRMFRELINLVGIERPSTKCFTWANTAVIRNDRALKMYPESLQRAVKDLARKIEIQAKLQSYKKLPKRNAGFSFMGVTKLDLYKKLVESARAARTKLHETASATACCGNCKVDELRRAVQRVMRFEYRYPPTIKEFYTPEEKARIPVGTMHFPIETVFNIEVTRNYPVLQVKDAVGLESFIDVALEAKWLAREVEWNWAGYISENSTLDLYTMASKPFAKFREKQPTALSYGAFGAILANNFLRKETRIDTLGPQELKTVLDMAWGTYVNNKHHNPEQYGNLAVLEDLNDDALFFLAFANTQCGSKNGKTLNQLLKPYEPFKNAYGCHGRKKEEQTKEKVYIAED